MPSFTPAITSRAVFSVTAMAHSSRQQRKRTFFISSIFNMLSHPNALTGEQSRSFTPTRAAADAPLATSTSPAATRALAAGLPTPHRFSQRLRDNEVGIDG